ncbi:hypothetical protein SNE40_016249 [Patella caerulea]|uniref:Uncharacterized protein n=1 Tax=Patella caerulea TaxID=87958 RepID=A0AAN8PCX3_PATCE
MEGIQDLKSLIIKGDFMKKLDLMDAYFTFGESKEIFTFSLARKNLRIPSSSIWTSTGTSCLHKNSKTSGSFPAPFRNTDCNLFGRHDTNKSFKSPVIKRYEFPTLAFGTSGFHDKHQEIYSDSHSTDRIPGVSDRFNSNDHFLTKGKICKIEQSCQKMIEKKSTSVRKLAEILGYMTSSLQTIAPASLHYRQLQMSQINTLLTSK